MCTPGCRACPSWLPPSTPPVSACNAPHFCQQHASPRRRHRQGQCAACVSLRRPHLPGGLLPAGRQACPCSAGWRPPRLHPDALLQARHQRSGRGVHSASLCFPVCHVLVAPCRPEAHCRQANLGGILPAIHSEACLAAHPTEKCWKARTSQAPDSWQHDAAQLPCLPSCLPALLPSLRCRPVVRDATACRPPAPCCGVPPTLQRTPSSRCARLGVAACLSGGPSIDSAVPGLPVMAWCANCWRGRQDSRPARKPASAPTACLPSAVKRVCERRGDGAARHRQ